MANILIVDDSKTMREMVNHALTDAGHSVSEAEDGQKAMDVFTGGRWDLIITDLNMPNMDGFGLIEAVRGGDTQQYVPILMLTTESDSAKKERGKAAGATGWIVKPFNPDKLVQVVEKVCG